MKKKIFIGLGGLVFVTLLITNVSLVTNGITGVTSLSSIVKMAKAVDSEGGVGKFGKVSNFVGTITETIDINGVKNTRTCQYSQVICEAIGNIDCQPSFCTYNCTNWRQV